MQPSLARYHRQMLLPGFGEEGQRRLLGSKVLIVGCGALGSVVANILARTGVGHLVIVDRDYVEITNLQRQMLFDEADVAESLPKAIAAKEKLAAINSQIKVTAVVDDVNHTNCESLAEGCQAILDGVDNFETRFLMNDVSVKLGIPYVYSGAVGTVGMSMAMLPHTVSGDAPWEKAGRGTPCLRCLFDQAPPPGMHPTCDTVGVLGPAVSMIADYEAAEAMKILTGNWAVISSSLLHVDLWDSTFRQIRIGPANRSTDCQCCGRRNFEYLEGRFSSAGTVLCGRNAIQLTRNVGDRPQLNFDQIAERLKPHGPVQTNRFVLRAEITDNGTTYELTLFRDGRAIVKGTKQASTARSIYAKYVGA